MEKEQQYRRYGVRIVVDAEFLKELEESGDYDFNKVIHRLSYINRSSKAHTLEHNKILGECLDDFLEESQVGENMIIGALRDEPLPEKVDGGDSRITKVTRFAVNLADNEPYNTYIFTSDDRVEKYRENEHFKKVPAGVKVAGIDRAYQVIDNLHPAREPEEEIL